MPFNSVGQYTPRHKTWDHLGNVFPNVEHSEGIRPSIEFKPAEWLPVKFFDKYYEDFYVVTPGKILACDNDGRVVPCQYADHSVTITYTQDDVDEGTVDVTTGSAVTAPKSVAVSGVTSFLGRSGVNLSVSKPIGVAPYGYLQWAGGDGVNPTQLRKHNYNRQHQVAVLCDYVLTLPLVPGEEENEALDSWSTDGNVHTESLARTPVAKNTVRTPITFADGGSGDSEDFTNEVGSASEVTAEGDWHVNLEDGTLTLYRAAGAPSGVTVTYFTYDKAPEDVSVFASAVGDLTCGDFVKCDENSNYQKAEANDNFQDIVGQVLEVVEFPRSALDKVKTAFQPAINTDASGSLPGFSGQTDQLPGSATGGMPDAVHFSGASNLMVRINLISR